MWPGWAEGWGWNHLKATLSHVWHLGREDSNIQGVEHGGLCEHLCRQINRSRNSLLDGFRITGRLKYQLRPPRPQERKPGGSRRAFHDQALEARAHCFSLSVEAATKTCPGSGKEKQSSTLDWGESRKVCDTENTAVVIFGKYNLSLYSAKRLALDNLQIILLGPCEPFALMRAGKPHSCPDAVLTWAQKTRGKVSDCGTKVIALLLAVRVLGVLMGCRIAIHSEAFQG